LCCGHAMRTLGIAYATGLGMTGDAPFGGSTAGDSSGGVARFPRQPLPTEQSVLWRPAVQELARPDDEPSLIFIAQRALAAVEDHLVSAPHEALLGFLVGRVFETPETGMPYVIVHGAVRVPQMIVDGASERVVAQALAAAQRMLPPEDGVVVGWYRSDPTGVLKISPDDHLAHVRHFPGPWQVVLLMTIRASGARGGCFRPASEPGSPAPYLPFYELLDAENFRDGWKQPRVTWSNYWSPDPAVWRVRSEPARAPRVTPSGRPSGASRFIPIVEPDDDDPAWRVPRRHGSGAWRWWLLAFAAVGSGGRQPGRGRGPGGGRLRALGLSAAVKLVLLAALGLVYQQGTQPLRKAELVRLLATKTRSRADVMALVRRNCVTFRPSERDRADLRAAGADDALLAAIDQCLRTRTAARPNAPPPPPAAAAPAKPAQPAPVARPLVAPLRVIVSQQIAATAGTAADVAVQLYRGTDP